MLTFLLWLRYLKQRKIVFLSITAVAVSVALLIVVASLFKGFILAYEQSAVDLIGDVLLMTPKDVNHYDTLIARLEETLEVEAATPTIFTRGLLHLGRGVVRAVDIWGIEPAGLARVTRLKPSLRRQANLSEAPSFSWTDMPPAGVGGFVGVGLVADPNEDGGTYDWVTADALMGKRVLLTCGAVSSGNENTEQAERPRRRTIAFTVTDILHTGNHMFDAESICIPLQTLHDRLHATRSEVRVNRIQIKLATGAEVAQAIDRIEQVWRDFAEDMGIHPYIAQHADVVTARELQRLYMAVISQQMSMLMVIFGVIDVGVVVLVFCIFFLIVQMKKKDVAVIKSCGGSSWLVVRLFLGFGACVGLVGVGAGIGLGWTFMININGIEDWIHRVFGLQLWNSSAYLFEQIPSQVNWGAVGIICLVALAATTFGALLPACLAAWTRPVKVLRYE